MCFFNSMSHWKGNCAMKPDEIRTGIKYAFELETEIEIIKRTLDSMKKKANCLGIKKKIPRITYEKKELKFNITGIIPIIAAIIGAIYGIRYGIECARHPWEDYITIDVLVTVPLFFMIFLLLFLVIGYAIDAVFSFLFLYLPKKKKIDAENLKILERESLENDFEKIKEEQRIRDELKLKSIIEEDIQIYSDNLTLHKNELKKLYDAMEILEEYRGFVQMGYMYQYLRMGFEPKLGGKDGLYDLVRRELRADRIEGELRNIRLSIIQTGNRLYGAICDLNDTTNRLLSQMEQDAQHNRIVEQKADDFFARFDDQTNKLTNTATAIAYNTERSKRLLEYADFRRRIR